MRAPIDAIPQASCLLSCTLNASATPAGTRGSARSHPRAEIGALLPEADFLERAGDAVLDKIVGRRDITRQNPRIAPQSRKDC